MASGKAFNRFTKKDLSEFLVEKKILDKDEAKELEEREIDGEAFCSLSREDISVLFPEKHQFLLGSRLYREVQRFRQHSMSTLESSDQDISSVYGDSSSPNDLVASNGSQTGSQKSLSNSKRPQSTSNSSQAKKKNTTLSTFVLPKFSPDITQAVKCDEFYTATLRNKLIREACRALKGHCQQIGKSPTTVEKKALGRKLYDLSPKSLGDPDGLAVAGIPEASLNRQIQKWFQNNEFSDRKSMGMVRQNQPKSNSVSGSTYEGDTEDENISADHIIELQREMKRPQNHWDIDKIARLLSLSYKSRMESCGTGRGSQTRIAESMTAYPCFKYPIFLIQELFHKCEKKFFDISMVYDLLRHKQEIWIESLMPAMVAVYEATSNSNDKLPEEINEMQCLEMIVDHLKPRSSKQTSKVRISHILCADESLDACKRSHPGNDPYIAVVGKIDEMSSCHLICDQRVILNLPCGCNVANLLLVLIAFCHKYNLQYSPEVGDVMELLQDKLLDLSEKTKHGIAYNNLYRAISCQQKKLCQEAVAGKETMSVDSDATLLDIIDTQVTLFAW